MSAWQPRCSLLLALVACADDSSDPSTPPADGGPLDSGAPDRGDAGGLACIQPTPCLTAVGQQGQRACLDGRFANECLPSEAGTRDAQAEDDGAAPTACPAGLVCDDALAALRSLGFADDAGVQLACGSLAKEPLFGLGEVFQPPSCRSKADCVALGLEVPCQTFRSFGDRCTRPCTR